MTGSKIQLDNKNQFKNSQLTDYQHTQREKFLKEAQNKHHEAKTKLDDFYKEVQEADKIIETFSHDFFEIYSDKKGIL